MEGLKSHHGIRDFLDETMILFDHIVQIFDLTDFYKTDQSCQHQQPIDILNAGIVGTAFIHDDFMSEAGHPSFAERQESSSPQKR